MGTHMRSTHVSTKWMEVKPTSSVCLTVIMKCRKVLGALTKACARGESFRIDCRTVQWQSYIPGQ